MIDVAGFVNWPLFIWFHCSVVVQLLIVGISRFMAPGPSTPKSNGKFEILFLKIFSLKTKFKSITSRYFRENEILSRQGNSLVFLHTITSSFVVTLK